MSISCSLDYFHLSEYLSPFNFSYFFDPISPSHSNASLLSLRPWPAITFFITYSNSLYHSHFSSLTSPPAQPIPSQCCWVWSGQVDLATLKTAVVMWAFYFQLYILSKKERQKRKIETCDVTSALLPPSEGAPARGSTHMEEHMLTRRSTDTCRCAVKKHTHPCLFISPSTQHQKHAGCLSLLYTVHAK